jgi:hypothetical protein
MSNASFFALPFYREPIEPSIIIGSTLHSSQRYGNCEHCFQFANEVFYGRTQLPYRRPDGSNGRTIGPSLFGHLKCVTSRLETALVKRGFAPVIEIKVRSTIE